jgi:uncharacterized protein (TIGR03435 family)
MILSASLICCYPDEAEGKLMSYRALARCYAVLILLVVCLFERSACAQTANETSPSHGEFRFDVVSIKLNKNPPFGPWGTGSLSLPDGVHLVGGNTYRILALAYLPEDAMDWKNAIIINAPEWVTSEKYDIDARVADKDLKAWGNQKGHMYEHVYLRAAVRNLLKERYKLQAHLVNTQVPYLSIVVNKNHNKLVAVYGNTAGSRGCFEPSSSERRSLGNEQR